MQVSDYVQSYIRQNQTKGDGLIILNRLFSEYFHREYVIVKHKNNCRHASFLEMRELAKNVDMNWKIIATSILSTDEVLRREIDESAALNLVHSKLGLMTVTF